MVGKLHLNCDPNSKTEIFNNLKISNCKKSKREMVSKLNNDLKKILSFIICLFQSNTDKDINRKLIIYVVKCIYICNDKQ